MTSERLRLLRRLALTGAFGFVVFLISFAFAFPYDRIEQIVAAASAQNMDVEVGSAGPRFGVGVALKDISIRTRAEAPRKPTRIHIDAADIGVSPLAQLRGEVDYSLVLQALGGEIEAKIQSAKTAGALKINTRGVSMAEVPGVKEADQPAARGAHGRPGRSHDARQPEHGGLGHRRLEVRRLRARRRQGEAEESRATRCSRRGSACRACGSETSSARWSSTRGWGACRTSTRSRPTARCKSRGNPAVGSGGPFVHGSLRAVPLLGRAPQELGQAAVIMQISESMGKRTDGFYGFRLTGSFSHMGPVQWLKTSPFGATPGGGGAMGPRAAASRALGMAARVQAESAQPTAATEE